MEVKSYLEIMVDDWGFDQLRWAANRGLSGYQDGYVPEGLAETPNLDRFFDESVAYRRAFSSSICSTTRAQILSGKYPGLSEKNCIGAIVKEDGRNGPYDLDGQTCYHDAAELGAKRAHFGKLHIVRDRVAVEERGDTPPEKLPPDDHRFAVDVLGANYYQGLLRNPNNQPSPERDDEHAQGSYYSYFETTADDEGNTEVVARDVWATRRQIMQAARWMRDTDDPFHVKIWTSACHGPFHPWNFPPEDLIKTGRVASDTDIWNNAKSYIEAFDTLFGLLRRTLESADKWDETTIVFMVDNGTDNKAIREQFNQGQLGGLDPLRFKAQPFMQGTNVPFFVKPRKSANVPVGVVNYEYLDYADLRKETLKIMKGEKALHSGKEFSYTSRYSPNGRLCDAASFQRGLAFKMINGKEYRVIYRRTDHHDMPPEVYEIVNHQEVAITDQELITACVERAEEYLVYAQRMSA